MQMTPEQLRAYANTLANEEADVFNAHADRIVCTPDSVNRLSEACGTRAPVQVFEPDRVSGRPRRFIDALLRHGRVRDLADGRAPFGGEPLRETARIAAEVRARLNLPDR